MSDAGPPEVSVIMPAYNVRDYVTEAVDSVAAQTLGDLELIAIDDGSSDDTAHVLRDLAGDWSARGRTMSVLEQPNAGAGAARNTGLDHARGVFVAFLDADDIWTPDLLTHLVQLMRDDPVLDIAFPRYDYIDRHGARIGVTSRPQKQRFDLGDLLMRNPMHSATGVMVRTASARRAGRFDTSLPAAIDVDFWIRVVAGRGATVGFAPDAMAKYRRRPHQITSRWQRMEAGWTRVLEKAAKLDPDRVRQVAQSARASHYVYWSTIAYTGGDYPAARRLIRCAWAASPATVARHRHGLIRTGACLVSYLPDGLHGSLRRGFEKARRKLGLDLS